MAEIESRRPFTRSDAVAAGVDPKILRSSRYRRLFRSVYIRKEGLDATSRMRAALALHPPTAFLSQHTAAKVWKLPVPHDSEVHVSVLRPEERCFRRGIRLHVTTEAKPDVVEVDGMRVCHPLRMFVQLAGRLDLVDMVVLGDAMVRILAIRPEEIIAYCAGSDRHHAGRALRAAEFVRAGVDSPMESRLRMLIVLAGLPEPTVNLVIRDAFGNVVRRHDMAYGEVRLIIEYDGRQHAESADQWDRDIDRREAADDDGWHILTVRSRDVYRDPARTIERIRRKLLALGWCQPIVVRPEWRHHFLGR